MPIPWGEKHLASRHLPSPPRRKGRLFRRPAPALALLAASVISLAVVISDGGRLRDGARSVYTRVRAMRQDRIYARQFSPLTAAAPGKTPPATVTVAVRVDGEQDLHPISPLIYGMAFAPADYVRDLRLGSNRWGGNDKTRYNWVQGNACNAARDWRFANRLAVQVPGLKDGPSSAADWFVRENRTAGAETLLTVPTIGWVARDTDNGHASLDVPAEGGPPVGPNGAIAGYDPSANRARTSVPSFARRDPASPPTLAAGAVYQDQWIAHLKRRFGAADKGGVRLYAMDNEPDLWDATHTDVHPARPGYDELRSQFLDYARAVKAVDASAQVTGPVSWGWTGYHYSPLDRGTDNFRTHADRKRHGGDPFLLWFLKQIRAADLTAGSRTLDVLDVHFYPQGAGLYGGTSSDAATRERRLRATRSLWDPAYTDESWIAEPIALLPRLRRWIGEGYPGTRIGITEWNFGGDTDISGALAIAETLGIFGKESVYLANYWAFPPRESPGYLAFKLFRNCDDRGRGFGDRSCRAVSGNAELVSCYAATETKTGALTLMLINKMPETTAHVPLAVHGGKWAPLTATRMSAWRLDSAAPGSLRSCPPENIMTVATHGDASRELILPPYSATLIRLGAAATRSDAGTESRKSGAAAAARTNYYGS